MTTSLPPVIHKSTSANLALTTLQESSSEASILLVVCCAAYEKPDNYSSLLIDNQLGPGHRMWKHSQGGAKCDAAYIRIRPGVACPHGCNACQRPACAVPCANYPSGHANTCIKSDEASVKDVFRHYLVASQKCSRAAGVHTDFVRESGAA